MDFLGRSGDLSVLGGLLHMTLTSCTAFRPALIIRATLIDHTLLAL